MLSVYLEVTNVFKDVAMSELRTQIEQHLRKAQRLPPIVPFPPPHNIPVRLSPFYQGATTMNPNQHITPIPPAVMEQIKQTTRTLKELLAPYALALTPAERHDLPKMGEKTSVSSKKPLNWPAKTPPCARPVSNSKNLCVIFAGSAGRQPRNSGGSVMARVKNRASRRRSQTASECLPERRYRLAMRELASDRRVDSTSRNAL
jgi:hypothetical protein